MAAKATRRVPATVDSRSAPIGDVKDALTKNIPTEKADEKDASEKKRDTSKPAPITTLAQLRDWHVANGTAPTQEEIDKVKQIEKETMEKGAEQVRTTPKEK